MKYESFSLTLPPPLGGFTVGVIRQPTRLLLALSLPLLLAACQSSTNTAAPQVTIGEVLDALSPQALTPTTLNIGQTRQFVVTVNGQTAQAGQLLWTSSAPSVASVSQSGLVTALAAGNTTVRAALASNRNAYLDFPVTVLAVSSAPAPTPTPTPAPTPTGTFAQQVLDLTNAARAKGQTCGGVAYPAVAPLTYNAQLEQAAQLHASDMATKNYFSHTSQDGRTFDQRISAAGYAWKQVAENISAGQTTPAEVVSGWLASAGHCQNIMSAGLKELGVGYAYNASSTYRYYWVQDFGRQ